MAHIKTLLAAALLACLPSAHAIVLYNPNVAGSTTAPENFGYWNNVVSTNGASGVYLGEGWVLTANHVGTPATITIDGMVKTVASSVQVGNADLRLIRVSNWENISLPSINAYQGRLYTTESYDYNGQTYTTQTGIENGKTAYAIGYGAGAGTAVTGGYQWNSTYTKRWGLVTLGGDGATIGGTNTTTTSYFDRSLGDHAGAFALNDSGGGTFYQDDNGIWHLGGIITNVSQSGVSYYDQYPAYAGNQPSYGVSQRLASTNGLDIYRITGVWGSAGTTGTYDGTNWTEGSNTSAHIVTTGTLHLMENAKWDMVETQTAAGINAEGKSVDIGTILTRGTNPLTLENGSFSIQVLDVETGGSATLKNGTFAINALTSRVPSLTIQNAAATIASYGGNLDTLTLENGSIEHQSLKVKTLRILGNSSIQNADTMYISFPGGTPSPMYSNIEVATRVEIGAGATGDTHGFRMASTASLSNAGNLEINEGHIDSATFYSNNFTTEADSKITLELDSLGSDRIEFLGSGTVNLFGTLQLRILSTLAATQYTLMTYNSTTTLNLLFDNIIDGRVVSTDGTTSFALTRSTNSQTGVTSIIASDLQTVPEPGPFGLLSIGMLLVFFAWKRFGKISTFQPAKLSSTILRDFCDH